MDIPIRLLQDAYAYPKDTVFWLIIGYEINLKNL